MWKATESSVITVMDWYAQVLPERASILNSLSFVDTSSGDCVKHEMLGQAS